MTAHCDCGCYLHNLAKSERMKINFKSMSNQSIILIIVVVVCNL